MSNLLTVLWSWPFIVGVVIGSVGMRAYQWSQCRYLDAHYPRPDGAKRHPTPISRVWQGGLLTAAVLLYVLSQGQQTHDETVALSERTAQCQEDLIRSITRSRQIAAENDDLSIQQRELFAQLGEANMTWLSRIIDLPDDIKDLDPSDPRVQQYGVTVTRVYSQRVVRLVTDIRAITKRQGELAKDRENNPLPSPRCGRD